MYQTYRDDRAQTWRVRASGGAPEKLLDRGFRGDWIRQPGGQGTWLATSRSGGGITLIDAERGAVVWEQAMQGGGLSLRVFSADGRFINAPFRQNRENDVVRVFDTATRFDSSRLAPSVDQWLRISLVDNTCDCRTVEEVRCQVGPARHRTPRLHSNS